MFAHQAQLMPRRCVPRSEFHRLAEKESRLIPGLQPSEHLTQLQTGFELTRDEAIDSFKRLPRRLPVLQRDIRRGEVTMICRFGVTQTDGCADMFDGLSRLLRLIGGDAEQMPGAMMPRVGLKDISIKDFCFVEASRLMCLNRLTEELRSGGHDGSQEFVDREFIG